MERVRAVIGCDERECRGYTGRNVGVAILDTGIFLHQDLKERVVGFYDVVNRETYPYDDNGHGTHISGIVGSSGQTVNGKYRGIAPDCHLIGIKILDNKGNGTVENLVKATQWLLENRHRYNISIVNISVGMFPRVGTRDRNMLIRSVEQLWDDGLVVVTAAGNNGPRAGSVTYPGISRKVITVGTVQERRAQKNFSGRGPTPFCVMKPEVVAPGYQIMSCNNNMTGYVTKSGTSMATPVVSGAICCLLEKYRDFTPAQVKMRIHDSAKDLGFSKHIQGWGQLWMPDLLTM